MSGPSRFKIAAIVEGDGEVRAVPILLQNWFRFRRFHNFEPAQLTVKAHLGSLLCDYDPGKQRGIEYYVDLAMRGGPDAILIIFDADDACKERRRVLPYVPLGPDILARAKRHVAHVPVGVVVANMEYEAWFLASYRRLKNVGLFPKDTKFREGFNVETLRDCKGEVSQIIGRKYSETADQKSLTAEIGFRSYMSNYSPSFGKLLRELERISHEARQKYRLQRAGN
jgi:hypothetical protein